MSGSSESAAGRLTTNPRYRHPGTDRGVAGQSLDDGQRSATRLPSPIERGPRTAPARQSAAEKIQPQRIQDRGPATDEVPVGGATAGAVLLFAIALGTALVRVSGTTAGLLAGAPGTSLWLQGQMTIQSLRRRLWNARRYLPFPSYSRYDDSDPLENDRRARLYETITDSPGVDLPTLVADTGMSRSTARYHLRILEHEQRITAQKVWGKRRLFPVNVGEVELQAAVRDETSLAVLEAIARHEPASGTTLAGELDRDASTITHHLTRLADAGLVERERDGRAVVNRLTTEARRVVATSPASSSPGERTVESDD